MINIVHPWIATKQKSLLKQLHNGDISRAYMWIWKTKARWWQSSTEELRNPTTDKMKFRIHGFSSGEYVYMGLQRHWL